MTIDFSVVLSVLVFAGFLALAVSKIVEGFFTPLFDKFNLDKIWLQYVAWVFGAIAAFGFNIDLITPLATQAGLVVDTVVLGKVISSLIVGGGANMIWDVFDYNTPKLVKTYTAYLGEPAPKTNVS
jgi:hypothetical protein